VELIIQQLSDGEDSLDSLARWLRRDTGLMRVAQVYPATTSTAPDRMGTWVDILNVIMTHVEALSSLALSYAAWRSQNREAASIVFHIDGEQVVDRDGDPALARRIVSLSKFSDIAQDRLEDDTTESKMRDDEGPQNKGYSVHP
jgi:hypothetical protein